MRKQRRPLTTAAIPLIMGILPTSVVAQGIPSALRESHGTINILFANHNGLVAVTDSMLSSADNKSHYPDHQKLFQIDDKTVCMMAGIYSAAGIENSPDFSVWVPNIMSGFATQLKKDGSRGNLSFAWKFTSLKRTFEHQLTANLQAQVVAQPEIDISKLQPIELTLAGYDLDGTVKVGAITLTPRKNKNGIFFDASGLPKTNHPPPMCELRAGFDASALYDYEQVPKPRMVGGALFCEVAGIPDGVAEIEAILSNPTNVALPAVRDYDSAEKDGRALSLEEMERLAVALEDQIAKQEIRSGQLRVGGEQNVAVLSNGAVEKAPAMIEMAPDQGTALNNAQFSDIGVDCGFGQFDKTMNMDATLTAPEVSFRVRHCQMFIRDKVIYHDSHFDESQLSYSGNGPLRFAANNEVNGSTLTLGAQVDLALEDVKRFMCGFPWKAVFTGDREIHPTCN